MRRSKVLAVSVLTVGSMIALRASAEAKYGELPDGAVSVSEQTGVHAEICRDHLLAPSAMHARLPDGYRLATAGELASKDEGLSALLAQTPHYAAYFVASLCFMQADAFVVDGVRAHGKGPVSMAFSWARVAASGEASVDPRARGKTSWVQLASWYSNSATDQALIRRTDPMAEFVDLRVEEIATDHWRMRMVLPDGLVRAEVRTRGPSVRRDAPEPGFMTVLFSGESADDFTVFTYFGHQHREAAGRWSATGRTAFTEAFQIRGEGDAFGTYFQHGWQARAGLYRRRLHVERVDER